MLFIFGWRVFYHTIGQGAFFCRKCGGDRRYRLRAGRRFVTLFFLPVIPLTRAGRHVQCLTCRTRYVPEVLALPTSAEMQAALPAAMRAAAAVMLHTGDPGRPAARQAAAAAISASGGPAGEDALPSTPPSAEATRHALGQVARQLSPDARELFLDRVVRIGTAGGPLTERERQAAYAIAAALGMTQAQAVGVITLAERAAHD